MTDEPDPLAALAALPDIPEALAEARASVDQALRHRGLRRHGGVVAAEAGLRSARASAALEGHPYPLDELRAGTVTDPVAQGALRLAEALPGLVDVWPRAPRQVLARLHVLAARDVVAADELGRPTGSSSPDVAGRLDALTALVTGGTRAPAILLAAVVHGELLALRPFAGPYGLVARAAARLTLVAAGLDPRALLVADAGHLLREPEYRGAALAYATGTPDGLRSWLRHCASAVALGAAETATIAAAASAANTSP